MLSGLVPTGQPLTPVNVFMLLAFFNLLSVSTSFILPLILLETYDAYASLGRKEEFLLLENLPVITQSKDEDDTSNMERNSSKSMTCLAGNNNNNREEMSMNRKPTLCVSSLTYKQAKRKDEFILQDIEFIVAPERLTVITGPVGSGKSLLLSAIAGEISHISGTISCKGNIVYVPQLTWVFSGTKRENILFGNPYDEIKYTRTIEACALKEHIRKFPDGDQTVVGERCEVLSGGQRARVSLARAAYAEGDLYLLDDPLTAVDFEVGEYIFEQCIKGLLASKTRVITSHQEKHMQEADNAILLYKGQVLGKGSFFELKEKGILNKTVDPLYKKLDLGDQVT